MKNIILPIALVCISLTSAFGQARPPIRNGGADRELRECRAETDILRRDNREMSDRLRNPVRCDQNQNDRRQIDQLTRENDRLVRENQDLQLRANSLLDQVERLKIDNARLEIELRPDLDGRFNLAQSIQACGAITSYSQYCVQMAKDKQILASTIEQCSRIANDYTKYECVKNAGENGTNARQVEACLQVTSYQQYCVAMAGAKKLNPKVISACAGSSTNDYAKYQCINSL